LVKIAQQQKIFSNYLSEGNEHCNNGFCSTRGIASDEEGNVYFSMYNTIQVLNKKTDEVRTLFGKKEFYNPPFGLLYHEGYLWTGNGLRINLAKQQIEKVLKLEQIDEGVVAADLSNQVWYGAGNQLFKFDKERSEFVAFKDPTGIFHKEENKITYIQPSALNDDLIWVATNSKGIFKISKSKGTLKHITADSTSIPRLPTNRIIGMQEDSKGNLWVASASGVVNIDAKAERLNTYSTKDGLPNDFINGILLEGDSAVWISTDNGLSRLNFGAQSFLNKNVKVSTRRFFNFFQQDGISSNEFNRISLGSIVPKEQFIPKKHWKASRLKPKIASLNLTSPYSILIIQERTDTVICSKDTPKIGRLRSPKILFDSMTFRQEIILFV